MTVGRLNSEEIVPLELFAKRLGQFTKEELLPMQKKAVIQGIAKSIPLLVEASPVDTGLYAQSWDFTYDEKSAVLGNYAPHAPIIEDGARPFTPPIAPLLAWAKRILQDPSQPPEYSDAVWALAKYTQNKISEQGITPRHVLGNNLDAIIRNIKQEALNILERS